MDPSLITEAAQQNIQIECLSFIDTEAITDKEVQEEISRLSSQKITAVFTSMNAVDAIKSSVTQKAGWEIFCIGYATRKRVEEVFGETSVAATADDAIALAELIIQKKIKKVYFFCGDQRREELPARLNANNIQLEEITVYKTLPTPHLITKEYDGILFFSPSAVNSFFRVNHINSHTILFAIGKTTAQALQQQTNHPNIITANSPGKEALVKEIIHYYSTIHKTDEKV